MPIDSLHDLTQFDSEELYAVYLAIARADHQWRVRTLYGDEGSPAGHAEFRPLTIEQFDQRVDAANRIVGGDAMLRQRLARQAAAYNVDIGEEIYRLHPAA